MRPEARINRILGKLARVWHQPSKVDFPLGELLIGLNGGGDLDLWECEDDALDAYLDEALAGSGPVADYRVMKVTQRTRAPLTCLEGETPEDRDNPFDLPFPNDPSDVWDPAERERLDRIMDWWRAGKDVPSVDRT